MKAFRKLDKVIKEKGKAGYAFNIPENAQETFTVEDDGSWADDDDEDYVYFQEGDLDEVMDEADVMSALATYRKVRQAMRDQKKGYGFYGNGQGFGTKGKGKGGGKWQKIHME